MGTVIYTILCVIIAVLLVVIFNMVRIAIIKKRSRDRIDFIRGVYKAKILKIEKTDNYIVISLKIGQEQE